MNICEIFNGFKSFKIREWDFLQLGRAITVLDTPLHVDTVTDESKLPWHKYLKGQ
jgi:hypothetical protein